MSNASPYSEQLKDHCGLCVWHIYIPNVGAMSIIGGNLTPSKLTMPIEKTNFIPWNLDNKGAKGT